MSPILFSQALSRVVFRLECWLHCHVAGTLEERGIIAWKGVAQAEGDTDADLSVYDIPLIQPWLNRLAFTKYIPVCPGFVFDKKSSTEDGAPEEDVENSGYGEINGGYGEINGDYGEINGGYGEINDGYQHQDEKPAERERGVESRL
ncbi:solute carrier family 23 member 1 [Elysia marginata]|uniref:Solute carrier family 23 member 1 n=1 Tax=Elysia marginata TaxID=1093978 RepID=A0AAV4ESB1_9GAST|nr:solute carrier family 23 member 1 [Elysia marginata]